MKTLASTLRRSSSRLRPAPIEPAPIEPARRVGASDAQRRKVAGRGCVVCGRRPADPAHLVPQRLGGCGHPDCVIPLCRTHHRLFDCAGLALLPYLGRSFLRERRHALLHASEAELARALRQGWPAPWQSDKPEGDER